MKLLRSFAALIVPFLVAGCYEVSMDFNVNNDGSGTYVLGLEVDLDVVTALLAEEGEGVDPMAICKDMLSDAGGNELAGSDGEVETVNDGLVCRQIITGSWEAGGAEIVEESADDLSLIQVGDGWRFEFNMETFTSDFSGDEEMDPEVFALMGIEISYALAVTLPDAVTEHNGQLSGNTVSWEFNPLEPPEEKVLYVQATSSESAPEVGNSGAETSEDESFQAEDSSAEGPEVESDDEGYAEDESSAPLESAAEVESSEAETSEEISVEGESSADGSSSSTVVIAIIVLVVIAGVAIFLLRRKTNTAETPEVETPEVATAQVADSGSESAE